MKYEIQRFIDDKFRSGDGSAKKIIMISASAVLLLVAFVLIGRTLLGGGEPSLNERQSGMAEQLSEEQVQKIQEEGYVGGTRMVAPSDGG